MSIPIAMSCAQNCRLIFVATLFRVYLPHHCCLGLQKIYRYLDKFIGSIVDTFEFFFPAVFPLNVFDMVLMMAGF